MGSPSPCPAFRDYAKQSKAESCEELRIRSLGLTSTSDSGFYSRLDYLLQPPEGLQRTRRSLRDHVRAISPLQIGNELGSALENGITKFFGPDATDQAADSVQLEPSILGEPYTSFRHQLARLRAYRDTSKRHLRLHSFIDGQVAHLVSVSITLHALTHRNHISYDQGGFDRLCALVPVGT